MAHTKAGGAAKRTVNVAGKRLGIKKFGGEFVQSGNIIVRQIGSKFHPGLNTMMGKDYTIFAVDSGVVSFRQMTGFKRAKKYVDVLPATAAETTEKVATKPAKASTEIEKVVAKPAKTTKKATATKAK